MTRRALIALLRMTAIGVFVLMVVSAQKDSPAQQEGRDKDNGEGKKPPLPPGVYDPYPPGILPADLTSEIERVPRAYERPEAADDLLLQGDLDGEQRDEQWGGQPCQTVHHPRARRIVAYPKRD